MLPHRASSAGDPVKPRTAGDRSHLSPKWLESSWNYLRQPGHVSPGVLIAPHSHRTNAGPARASGGGGGGGKGGGSGGGPAAGRNTPGFLISMASISSCTPSVTEPKRTRSVRSTLPKLSGEDPPARTNDVPLLDPRSAIITVPPSSQISA